MVRDAPPFLEEVRRNIGAIEAEIEVCDSTFCCARAQTRMNIHQQTRMNTHQQTRMSIHQTINPTFNRNGVRFIPDSITRPNLNPKP